MKCLFAAAAGAALLAGTAIPAQSAVTVLGKNAARSCYEAARDHRSNLIALGVCNNAMDGQMTWSDRVATHVNRGIVHMLRNDEAQSMRDFDEAIALDPTEAEAYLNKGILFLRDPGRESEALALINTALERKTEKPAIAYYVRGTAHEYMGNVRAAYLDYRRAAELDPKWTVPAEELKRFTVRRRG